MKLYSIALVEVILSVRSWTGNGVSYWTKKYLGDTLSLYVRKSIVKRSKA
jgi:hypothetical protein